MRHHQRLRVTSAMLATLALAACNDSPDGPPPPPATTDVATTVVDGAITNALVCVDRNGNGECDAGETQARTDAAGHATLAVPNEDVGKYTLVAMVGTDATDADHGAVTTAYTLAAPADQTAVVSPLTTLVAQTVLAGGVTSAEAAATLQAATGLGVSPFADYTKTAAPAGTLPPARLSRMFVLTAQSHLRAIASAAGTRAADGSTITAGDLAKVTLQQVLVLLPSLVDAVADPALADKSAAEVEAALGSAADAIVAASGLTPASAVDAVAIVKAAPEASAPPAAGVQLIELNFTDASNWATRLLTNSLAQATPDAAGNIRFVDRRARAAAGQVATWSTGSDPWRNADLHWDGSAWSACPVNFESKASVRDASGNNRFDYCQGLNTGGTHRVVLDVAGQRMADVYASARALGNTNLAVGDPALLGSATFPAGSKVFYQSQTDTTRAFAYYPAGADNPAGTSNVVTQYGAAIAAGGNAATQPAGEACNAAEARGSGTPSTTLEALVAAKGGTPCVFGTGSFVYGGVTYTSDTPNEWWGNSTVSLGKLGSVPLNTGAAPGFYSGNTLLRVAFTGGAANAVTYYACKERFTDGSPRSCSAIGSGSYTIATLGDARVMTFTGAPPQAGALTYQRVFVERGGHVYFGYQSKLLNVAQSARLNDTATKALLGQLGVPVEDASLPLALTAASYQGTWDARDAAETSLTAGTTVFFNADGSSSCRDRSTGANEVCTLTVTDTATGAFTLTSPASASVASGRFDFMAGNASGTYHDPTTTPADGSFVAFRR